MRYHLRQTKEHSFKAMMNAGIEVWLWFDFKNIEEATKEVILNWLLEKNYIEEKEEGKTSLFTYRENSRLT